MTGLTDDQRADFERDGYLLGRKALSADETNAARDAIMARHQAAEKTGQLDRHDALHQLSAVSSCPEIAFLLDHPATFPLVWSVLGWNLHVYHSHVDVHPPHRSPSEPHWGWHQDGGRQNREVETSPRPRLSVKLGYWLSDVSEPGRGNLMLVPGSHTTNWLPGPPRRDAVWAPPPGA